MSGSLYKKSNGTLEAREGRLSVSENPARALNVCRVAVPGSPAVEMHIKLSTTHNETVRRAPKLQGQPATDLLYELLPIDPQTPIVPVDVQPIEDESNLAMGLAWTNGG